MTESSKPPSGRRMKARAPPPPQAPQPAPRHIFRNAVPDGGGTSGMESKENILRPTVALQITLPQGYQTSVTEDGSKALMDLLVELCSRYHLNPALHTLELLSPEGHNLGFKPNALLGSLNVACVLLKEKVWEEKVVRRPAPKVPEKTVRLMVNYHGSQKTVLRVNPLLPLQALIPVICDKCEFDPAHVLLLKDSISRHELQLDKSLSDLEIKELYVHDQGLVLQPKMASAPALNYSDSIRSSTTSLGRAEKKGFLGIFQFSRRKSRTETTSMDMGDCDDKVIQNTDTQSNGLSTVSGVPSAQDRPNTLGQSQSTMTLPRMSPKSEAKKRRAPALPGAPTPTLGHISCESYQIGLGSESQQRKRKAPAPPPTPASITLGSDSTSTSATPTSESLSEAPTPVCRTKVAQSGTTAAASTAVTQTGRAAPLKTVVQPPPVCAATPTPSSPNPSRSTIDSLAVQDSSSELSHSLDDSDTDLDQAGSQCSSLTSSTVSGSVQVQPSAKASSSRMGESERSSSIAGKMHQESESESALNLKLDEVENNRQSAMGSTDCPAPPKPRRSPGQEPPQPVLPPTQSSPHTEPTESSCPQSPMEAEEAAPQSWLHSMQRSTSGSQKPETETPEEETVSLGSSSGGSSLPDQGYAASEGMTEGEDSGMVSSPTDTQPTSPDGSLSLDGVRQGGEKLPGPVRDNSSDSDEGCATWGSRHRHNDKNPQAKSDRLKDGYEDDPEFTAQIHQTLAEFEADLADHIDIASVKETPYTMSTDSNDVPVSVVDMDVPVTAIDEVLEDYENKIVVNKATSATRTESAGSKGPGLYQQSSAEPQNKNNNACTAADGNKSSSANTKQPSHPEQRRKENKPKGDKREEKIIETKMKETSNTDTNRVKRDKQTSAVKSNVDMPKHNKSAEIKPDPVERNADSLQEKKTVPPQTSQRTASTERDEEMHRVYQNNSGSDASHGKITRNFTSRFGMKSFTVVPPKPTVSHAATGVPAVTLTVGAIKIDDQGNMVKVGVSQNKVGGSSVSGTDYSEGSALLGKAKAFWSSNERQESAVPCNKGLIDKAKESTDGLKSTPTTVSDTKLSDMEDPKSTQTLLTKPAERPQPQEMVKEEEGDSSEPVNAIREERGDVEGNTLVSKHVQQPSNKPNLLLGIPSDLRKDLSFLKPSRRTSSQYVASAITKYTSKTSTRPASSQNVTDSSATSKPQALGFQRSGRSIQVNPHQSSQSFLSDNKENESAFKPNPPGPKRSMSFPEYMPDSQRDFVEGRQEQGGFGSSVGSSNTLGTTKNKHIQLSGPTQMNMAASNDRDNIKHILPRSPSPAQSSPLPPSAKPTTAPKTISQGQTNNIRDTTEQNTHLTPDVKPQPSVTAANTGEAPGPPPVTVFGPVKKFRPVISRSVEKETSLHSSLMEAIQTGGARDRLKKINPLGHNNMKKTSYDQEENEKCALLAAIRAQSNMGRLKKTKSEAADELEKFKKASEEESNAGPPSSLYSPPVFTPPPPPPPPAPMTAPPPPPPVLPQGKPSTAAHLSANASVNPALAREAMLEAIRSGSAAERLKKVAVPTKTVKVNGRLGTIQASSSTLPQQ